MSRSKCSYLQLPVLIAVTVMGLFLTFVCAHEVWAHEDREMEEITVWGQGRPMEQTHFSSPSSVLTPEDLISINAVTTEDLVKLEPSLIIRRRFIGDPNGTVGIRGANMFQTTRSMVFADGVPLHYFLQTQWNGSPRWSLVSADEIARIDVIYGPFSAEYSGNSMGGVVNIETAIPAERKFRLQGTLFSQHFDALGFDKNVNGYKGFASYGDKFGDLSVYLSYNRLENDSQPMDFLRATRREAAGGEQPVNGALQSTNEFANPVTVFGDSGVQQVTTDQLKFKLGYAMGEWFGLLNIAYENRDGVQDSVNNYLVSATGDSIWNGDVVQNGIAFNVRSNDFTVSEQDRKTLLLGGRVQGPLTDNWWLELNISYFDILRDEIRVSTANPRDPAHTPAGSLTDFDDAGWETAEIKLQTDQLFGHTGLNLVSGYRYEHYRLAVSNYNSADYAAGEKTFLSNASGGETTIHAWYAQLGWQITDLWDVALGGRYERWSSADGFFNDFTGNTFQDHADRSADRFSPKFSIGLDPDNPWRFRYSLARAYRFPIVEELFQNEFRTTGTSIADAGLKPENGLHHNLSVEHLLDQGAVRINLFYETIEDVIFSQLAVVDNNFLFTFLAIDEVQTKGVEFIYNRFNVLNSRLDIRFNVAYTDAEITRNRINPATEGKTFPRMPKWRSNLMLTWHVNERWEVGGSISYASNSFGRLDNRDTASEVFGAQDSYTFVNLKTSYQVSENLQVSLGVDNVLDDLAFVFHPWPGRTVFLEGGFSF